MHYSRYNIFSKIRDSENYYIVNLLTGNADIVSPTDAQKIEDARNNAGLSDPVFTDELIEKGYFIDESEEQKLYLKKYLDFIDERDNEEVQLFFVPNYTCNFGCSYCYQDQYTPKNQLLSKELVDAFFNYVALKFANRKKYITLFGGEPLLNTAHQKEIISYFVKKTRDANLDLCIVTNGYNLEAYLPIIKKASIREIQITLDGTSEIHNTRRVLKDGSGTFDPIVKGIDTCLAEKITVNLRVVVDKENINNLPDLAQFAIDKKWTENPHFKTQLGRNYELHHCQSAPDKLFSRLSLYEELYKLIQEHPDIVKFYKPAYSVAKFISENDAMPDPLFDSCPACKTEWAFDYTGSIYSCTATVGKYDEKLGTFYPEITLDEKLTDTWEKRDVTSIPQCRDCNVQLACGGGCGSIAKNNTGSICSSDCRPAKELLELGFAAYLENN